MENNNINKETAEFIEEPQPRIVVKFNFRWAKGKWAAESGSQTYTFNFNNKNRNTDFESYATFKQMLAEDGAMIENEEKRKTYRDFVDLYFKKKIGQVEFVYMVNDQCHPYDVDELLGHFTSIGMRRI